MESSEGIGDPLLGPQHLPREGQLPHVVIEGRTPKAMKPCAGVLMLAVLSQDQCLSYIVHHQSYCV